jgi:hypothetical protein
VLVVNEDSPAGGRSPSSIKPPTIKPPTAQADTFGAATMGSAPAAAAPVYASAPPPPQATTGPQGPLARLMSTRVQSGVFWLIIALSLLIVGLLVILLALVVYMRLM